MDNHNSSRQFFKAVLYELFLSKRLYNLLASAILLGVVVLGYFWQERYTSSASILIEKGVDQGGAATLDEKRQQLVNLFHSPLFLDGLNKSLTANNALDENGITKLSEHLSVQATPGQLVHLTLRATTPKGAQAVLQEVIDAAFEHLVPIEQLDDVRAQVRQIAADIEALQREMNVYEVKLSSEQAEVAPTSSQQLLTRIASLRESLQDDEVELQATQTKIRTIRRELEKEKAALSANQNLQQNQNETEADLRRQRDNLNNLLIERRRELGFDAPAAVALENEIERINRQLDAVAQAPELDRQVDTSLYEQLRRQLTLAEVERQALYARIASLKQLLERELAKVETAQSSESEYQNISKQYESYLQQHNDLSKKKDQLAWQQNQLESALDIYKVFSKPSLPESYNGLGIVEFLLLSPLLALVIPFSLASLRVLCDFRIRTTRQLKKILPANVTVLAEIPHCSSPQTSRLFRKAMVGLLFWLVFVASVYFALGFIVLRY